MAGNSSNVRVWTLADVYVAPVGTTAPTDVSTPLAEDWVALGLLSEDGLSFTNESDTTDLFEYGGARVRRIRSHHVKDFSVTPLENTNEVWALTNPGSEASTNSGVTTRTVKTPVSGDIRAFVIELRDGEIVTRRVIPRAELSEVAEESITREEFPAPTLTFSVYPASDGTLYIELTNDEAAEVAA